MKFNPIHDDRSCQVCNMQAAMAACKPDANFIAGFAAAVLAFETEVDCVMCEEHAGLLQYYLDATYIEPIAPQLTPTPDRALN